MRYAALLIALVLCGNLSKAQRNNAQLGIKGGVNIANYNDDAGSRDARIGFNAGILLHFHVKPQLAFQPELVYSQQGADFGSVKQKVDYINFPFLFQYLFNRGFRLQTGPQIGVRAESELEYDNGVEVNNKRDIHSTDVSWVFGFGYLSSSNLGVDVRYNYGLTDVGKGPGELKNRVWQLGMFYQFRR